MIGAIIFLEKVKVVQIWMTHVNIFFSYFFTILGLTFVAITKKHDLPVRAHVNFPSTNRWYNSLPDGTISFYCHPTDTSLHWLQLCHLYFWCNLFQYSIIIFPKTACLKKVKLARGKQFLQPTLIGSYGKKSFFTMATKVKPTIVKIF